MTAIATDTQPASTPCLSGTYLHDINISTGFWGLQERCCLHHVSDVDRPVLAFNGRPVLGRAGVEDRMLKMFMLFT